MYRLYLLVLPRSSQHDIYINIYIARAGVGRYLKSAPLSPRIVVVVVVAAVVVAGASGARGASGASGASGAVQKVLAVVMQPGQSLRSQQGCWLAKD